jgi:hypothetical protein
MTTSAVFLSSENKLIIWVVFDFDFPIGSVSYKVSHYAKCKIRVPWKV